MKSYEIILKLRDKFSPGLMQAASTYQRVMTGMSRAWSKMSDWMDKTGRKWGVFRSSLSSPFRLRMDSSDVDRATRKTDTLIGRLKGLAGMSAGGGGAPGRRSGGLMPWLLGGAIAGGVGAMVMGGVDMASRYAGQAFQGTVGSAINMSSVRYNLGAQIGQRETAALERQIDAYAPGRKNDLLASAQRLAGSGIDQRKMMDTLKMLNNLSALSNTQTPELAMILSKIRSTGYLQGDEMDMFRERGINLNPYISKVMGIAPTSLRKAQEQGKITYDVFEKALNAYVGPNGGKFGNFFSQKLQTDVGLKRENLQGLWGAKAEQWGQKMLPAFGRLVDFLTEVLKKMGPVEKAGSRLWAAFGKIASSLGVLTKNGGAAEGVVSLLSIGLNGLAFFAEKSSSIIDFFVNNPMGKLLGVSLLAVKAISSLTIGWTALNVAFATSPLGVVHLGVVAIGAALLTAYNNSELFRNSILDGWEGWKTFFEGVGTGWEILKTGNISAFMEYSKTLDRVADRKANERIMAEKYRLMGGTSIPGTPGKNALINSQFLQGAPVGGDGTGKGGGTIADTGGLSSTVGNSKSQSVTISMQSLINHSEINVLGSDEGVDNLESKILDALNRLLYSAGHLATR